MKTLTTLLATTVALCAGQAGAFALVGSVYCDANQNQLIDDQDPPIPGVEVVDNLEDELILTDVTNGDGDYGFPNLDWGHHEVTLTASTLPADAAIVGEPVHTYTIDSFDPLSFHKDWLIDSAFCRAPVCGDGIVDAGEVCDDGNDVDGDGCSSSCRVERRQGCTPGYWRQPHHFDSYPAPYTPHTLFSDVFENAFPGKTLAQVARVRGGGINALGRHTVAALLNAANPEVSYPASVERVIAAFDRVHPGNKRNYNRLKNRFERMNERGCPLN